MRTTNGLDVPEGWGTKRPVEKAPCPYCMQAVRVIHSKGGYKLLDEHPRLGEKGRHRPCPGSAKLVDR